MKIRRVMNLRTDRAKSLMSRSVFSAFFRLFREKGTSSSATALNRSKKASEAVDVLRVVLRQSLKNGSNYVNANEVIAIILELAKDERTYGIIGIDLLSLLSGELLTRSEF